MNKFDLKPFITREQRAAHNETDIGEDTLFEVDTFEEFNNESFLN